MNSQACKMTDKEQLTDFLCNEKHLCSVYNSYCCEAATPALRATLLSALHDEHTLAGEMFGVMQSRGWYPTEKAEEQKLQKAKQQFAQYASV